jgi:TrmH family RNA methyltransferase
LETLSKIKNKWIRSLAIKKNRDRDGFYVVEGNKIVEELLQIYPERIELLVSTGKSFGTGSIPCFLVDSSEMKQLSSLTTATEVLAVVKMSEFEAAKEGFILALDGIQDPGNLGTIIRTADWFGIHSIVCSKDTVDVYNPKVIQATMGSVFRVNVSYLELDQYLSETKLPVYGALLDGLNAFETKINNEAILVIGNEGKGISDKVLGYITHKITIPKFGEAESLNAAMACGILLSRFRTN